MAIHRQEGIPWHYFGDKQSQNSKLWEEDDPIVWRSSGAVLYRRLVSGERDGAIFKTVAKFSRQRTDGGDIVEAWVDQTVIVGDTRRGTQIYISNTDENRDISDTLRVEIVVLDPLPKPYEALDGESKVIVDFRQTGRLRRAYVERPEGAQEGLVNIVEDHPKVREVLRRMDLYNPQNVVALPNKTIKQLYDMLTQPTLSEDILASIQYRKTKSPDIQALPLDMIRIAGEPPASNRIILN